MQLDPLNVEQARPVLTTGAASRFKKRPASARPVLESRPDQFLPRAPLAPRKLGAASPRSTGGAPSTNGSTGETLETITLASDTPPTSTMRLPPHRRPRSAVPVKLMGGAVESRSTSPRAQLVAPGSPRSINTDAKYGQPMYMSDKVAGLAGDRSAAEQLQYELGMTAQMLRHAHLELAAEREGACDAREAAQKALRASQIAREEADQVAQQWRAMEEQLARQMFAQRKRLEGELETIERERAEKGRTDAAARREKEAILERNRELEAAHAKARREADRLSGELQEARGRLQEQDVESRQQLELEREKRVNHLAQLGVRRIMQMGLAMGWNAWLDVYLSRKRCLQLLAASSARLMKPKLTACYRLWHDEWDANAKKTTAVTAMRASRELQEARKAKAEAEAQLSRVQADLRAAHQVRRPRAGAGTSESFREGDGRGSCG